MTEQPKYEQQFLDGFLEADADARESMVEEHERQLHLARQYLRFSKMQQKCKSKQVQDVLEKSKQQLIVLMHGRARS